MRFLQWMLTCNFLYRLRFCFLSCWNHLVCVEMSAPYLLSFFVAFRWKRVRLRRYQLLYALRLSIANNQWLAGRTNMSYGHNNHSRRNVKSMEKTQSVIVKVFHICCYSTCNPIWGLFQIPFGSLTPAGILRDAFNFYFFWEGGSQ